MKDILELLNKLKSYILQILPDILLSLFVILIGYLTGRIVKYLVIRLFVNIEGKVDQKFQNFNFLKTGTFLGTAFFWVIIFSSIIAISNILDIEFLSLLLEDVINYIPNTIAAILVVVASIIIGHLVSDAISSLNNVTGAKQNSALLKTFRFVIILLGIIIALDQIGIEIALLIDIIDIILAAILFGAAFAFALGSRQAISNILACYYLRKRYKEGDEIKIGKVKGIIIKIDAVSVIIKNEIGQVTIPAKYFNENVSYLITKE